MATKKKQAAAETPAPEKEHDEKHHQRKRRRQFIWLAVWLKLAWAGLIGMFFYFDHQINEVLAAHNVKVPGLETMESEMALARTRIAQLEQRVLSLQHAPQGQQEALAQQLQEQRSKIEALEKQIQSVRLAQRGNQTQSHLSGVVLSLVAAQKKLKDGQPFAAEMQKVNSLIVLAYGDTLPPVQKNALAQMTSAAEKGIRTEALLAQEFKRVAEKAFARRQQMETEKGWRSWFKTLLAKFITVRSLNPSGDAPEAILTRAEAAVKEGNLRLAAMQLQTLPDPMRREAGPWVGAVMRRVQVEEALLKLESHFTNALLVQMQAAQSGETNAQPEAPAAETSGG